MSGPAKYDKTDQKSYGEQVFGCPAVWLAEAFEENGYLVSPMTSEARSR